MKHPLKKNLRSGIAALTLAALLTPLSAPGVQPALAAGYTRKRRTPAPQVVIQMTPVPIPRPTATPSPAPDTGAEAVATSGVRSGFSFGYADVPAGLQAYQHPEETEVFGAFRESGPVYASAVSGGWVKLVFINAATQGITEVYAPTQGITETHALAADALRARLVKYQPVYYQGYPLPTMRFELFSDAAPEEVTAAQEAAAEPTKAEDESEEATPAPTEESQIDEAKAAEAEPTAEPAAQDAPSVSWETAVTQVRAEAVGHDVTVSWQGNGAADNYTVYMASADSVLHFAGKTENGENELTLRDLPDGRYLFLVRPRQIMDDIVWHGDPSASVSVAVPAVLWSTAVTDLRASVSGDERAAVVLTWKGNGKAAQYDIFELTEDSERLAGRASHAVTCILPDVSGEVHRYLVRPSRESDGQTELGEASETVTADLSELWRTAPRNVAAAVSGQQIALSWTGNRLTENWAVYEQTASGLEPLLQTDRPEASIEAEEGGHVYVIFPVRGEAEAELGDPSEELFTVTGDHLAFGRTDSGLVWTMDEDGTLRLYGSGLMEDFGPEHPAPWAEFREDISTVLMDPELLSVGSYAFDGCTWLSYALLPEKLELIGDSAFRACVSLSSLFFPESITELRAGAFSQSGLLFADLPAGLTTLGDAAFSGCGALASVSLPDSVSYIGEYAFSDCPSLVRVVSY